MAPAFDREDPGAARRPAYVPREPDESSTGWHPGSGFSAVMGAGFGGEDFVKASGDEGLSSGQGFLVGVGGMVTPFWIGEVVGFGAGVDLALKYAGLRAQNGSASITRFPLALTVHLLTNFNGRSHNYLFARAGVSRDLGVHYQADIDGQGLDVDADGTWGGTFSAGYYRTLKNEMAIDVMLFATLGDHVVNDHHIDANSFGVSGAVHFNL